MVPCGDSSTAVLTILLYTTVQIRAGSSDRPNLVTSERCAMGFESLKIIFGVVVLRGNVIKLRAGIFFFFFVVLSARFYGF